MRNAGRLTARLLVFAGLFAFALGDSKVLIVDKYAGEKSSIEEISLADYVSFALGGPVINRAAPRDALPARDLFDRARANLFVLVDGISAEQASSQQLLSIPNSRFLSLSRSADVEQTVENLVSGGTAHSFADVISQTFTGQSLTIAASGDHELSTRLAARLAGARKSNDIGFFWSPQKYAFESVYETGAPVGKPLLLSGRHILDQLRRASFPGVTLSMAALSMKATLSNGQEATFDFANEADMRFVAELAFGCKLVMALKENPALAALVNDQFPDSYALGFSSLKSFVSEPSKLAVAEAIVESCVSEIVSQLSALYGGSLTAEVVYFDQPAVLRLSVRAIGQTNNITNNTNSTSPPSPPSPPPYDPQQYDAEMVNFQILLWTNIALVFVTAAVIYVMLNLGWSSEGSDTMLYRAPKSHSN